MMDKATQSLSILDKDLKVEGTLNVEGKLVIVGTVEGTLLGNRVITVPGSHVVGQAMVKDMVIGGNFEGDVTVYQCLEISHTGKFRGNVVCKDLKVQPGGQLNGSVRPLGAGNEAPSSTTTGR
jgi:cytoskeletal protein CcmA (bactofilin family)